MAGRRGRRVGMLACWAAPAFLAPTVARGQSKAPDKPVEKVKEVLHGVELVDPYRWLEDQNSPRTRAWIASQNEYTQSLLKAFPQRAALARRLEALLKVDLQTTPTKRGSRYFFSRRLVNQD